MNLLHLAIANLAFSKHKAIGLSDQFQKAEKSVNLNAAFPQNDFGQQLALVSKMIGSKNCRGSNRDIFFISTGKFDHHSSVMNNLNDQFEILNQGLAAFVEEMKNLPDDVWDNVAVIVSSDFGR